jgi:hypothetical protein
MTALSRRLDQILDRITEEAFLSSQGIGNEIACYLFDYPAEDELEVRKHLDFLLGHLEKHYSQLKVLHLNLLDVVLAYLESRGLLEKSLKMERAKGSQAVLKALQGPLSAEKIRNFMDSEYHLADYQLILLSGVGSVWPMLRAHSLLNCLHTVMGEAPLVMFYPGSFDGTTLKLFDQIHPRSSKPGTKSYYRAFQLVPGENGSHANPEPL